MVWAPASVSTNNQLLRLRKHFHNRSNNWLLATLTENRPTRLGHHEPDTLLSAERA